MPLFRSKVLSARLRKSQQHGSGFFDTQFLSVIPDRHGLDQILYCTRDRWHGLGAKYSAVLRSHRDDVFDIPVAVDLGNCVSSIVSLLRISILSPQ